MPKTKKSEGAVGAGTAPALRYKTMSSKVTHICEHCNSPHQVYKSALKRGRGLFCSLQCARKYWHSKPTQVTCQNCHTIFYTRLGRMYCCSECTPPNTSPPNPPFRKTMKRTKQTSKITCQNLKITSPE